MAAVTVQIRRGTDTEHSSFTGAQAEITVNTTNDSLHIHDGSTASGFELLRADLDNVNSSALNTKIDTEIDSYLSAGTGISISSGTISADYANAALTGTPTAPTASTGTDTTQIATTAFVQQEINALKSLLYAYEQ